MHYWFPPSRPRRVKGGIKATQRVQAWWAQRWIDVLESFDIGSRLQRGRSYARNGQVLSIKISKGGVSAQVQGSRRKPYVVTISIKPLSDADWKNVAKTLSSQAVFAAQLLAGNMPHDIENVFAKAHTTLFPRKLDDLDTDCSCPDWSNPCKHIAAVFYVVGEEFDRDPFLMLRLRGIERERFLALIDTPRRSPAGSLHKQAKTSDEQRGEALSANPDLFWGGVRVPQDVIPPARVPIVVAAIPRRLGKFPLWTGEEDFIKALDVVYKDASMKAVLAFAGQDKVKLQ